MLAGLAAVAATAAASCATPGGPTPAPLTPPAPPAPAEPGAPPAPEVMPVVQAAPAVPAPAPPPVPKKLGPGGVAQPVWNSDGSGILFYDQPAAGQGGTWSVDVASGRVTRERAEWGYHWARATLLATPQARTRDTAVLHIPSGKRWTLPTSGATTFSYDGTVVAYSSGGTVVAGADNQGARRVTLPTGGNPVAWALGTDGWPNARLLLSGRANVRLDDGPVATPTPETGPTGPGTDLAIWAADVREGRRGGAAQAQQLARSKRLVGVLPSPDGTWMAHVAMWNPSGDDNGLFVTRTDGSVRRRLPVMGSYRWAADNRLLVIPLRAAFGDSHELWELRPESGALKRLTDPAVAPFRVANFDWDVSPDGTQIVYVSAEDRGYWTLRVPESSAGVDAALPVVPAPGLARSNGRPYRLPFETPPGPSTWYVAQWYGVTTGGYRWRTSSYGQGQGIHFGIDFAAPFRTPVVAVAPGRIIAVDGDYGSPPHNVVLETADGNQVMYGHLAERSRHVSEGQHVEAGQVVGMSGDSGYPYDGTRNPHLHLEVRRGGRRIATNPVAYFDVNWDDLGLGVWPGPLFEKDLDNPRANQFLDDQPEIYFGGPILTNFARPWPP
ncbi:MAG TPA: M23 family metallopeptidase [Chloroflexota bacterium]|nr:M23 family metallopeptidase [Chloroflexota bacterium]